MSTLMSIAELLIHQAEVRSQQVAFSGPDRTVTYAELETGTRRLGGHFASAGVAHGACIALVLGRGVETVECTLAVTRAGAVGLPLDPRSSLSELTEALRHSNAVAVITDGQRLARVRAAAPAGTKIFAVAADATTGVMGIEDLMDRPSSRSAPDNLAMDEPAWLFYTSGTTGNRKGVLSSQQAWLWSASQSCAPALGMTASDKLWWPLPLFHALGHSACIIGTIALGATAYIPGDGSLLESLLAQPVTVIAGVPTTYRELVAEARTASQPLPQPRACVTAGAPAPSGLSDEVEELFGVPLLNRYGCTETSGAISANRPGESYREDSCGTPLPGMEVRLMSPTQLTDVVEGEEGEIWVRSPSLMLGYYKDETKTPFIDGWYRTGDLGRKVGHGRLAVTGRLKELIIRGGENIHPGEVEKALRGCPGVQDIIVAGVPHVMLGEVPAAFIVPKPEGVDLTVLLAACRAVLPDYKVPASFYQIDAVPRTSTGKPRRGAVKTHTDHPLTAQLLAKEAIEPLVITETVAACSVESIDQFDPSQPFTTWGLTSLAGVVLCDRLSTLTGLRLPSTLVYNYPTPSAISQYLCDRLFGAPLPTIDPRIQFKDPAEDGEAIAIISAACRYPGGISSPKDLWKVVSEGIDATSEFPRDRGWDLNDLYDADPDSLGTSTTFRGGFLDAPADFDAGLFGISPREALATDPQQRLLLETAWELAERAGIAPSSLRGTRTGVFAGIMYAEYANRWSGVKNELEAHLGLGSAGSVAAGRISYALGLHGPSLAVDTACSSSLVAMHLAAASLRTGESSLAIAGGVTIMSSPHPFVMFSRQRGLAPDGRCRSYSADASGTAWSEGVGLLLLERLSDAKRNGHHIMGILRSTAVNSDGTSNGLAAPSGPAQEKVIEEALRTGGVSSADVDVIEGHGTATQLGDPIEVQALLSIYGRERKIPALLGSIKSNIGHSQAAAGVAGVIKMLLSMEKGVVPQSLHISEPSRHIDWENGAIELVTKARPWPQNNRPRRAAVSSFGIGGTNGHVIIEQYTEEARDSPSLEFSQDRSVRTPYPWIFSGADEEAMRAQARAVVSLKYDDPADVALSLATTRSALPYRAAVLSSDRAALLALAGGQAHPDVVTGVAKRARLAFLFSGQGTQRPRMGQELCKAFPVFNAAYIAACEHLDPHLGCPLSDVIDQGGDLLDRADFAQSAVFVFEVAMYRLLESWGIQPDYLAGHSVGEVAAAHVAGILSIKDAATLITSRGSLMSALPSGGAMASISASETEVAEVLKKVAAKDPQARPIKIAAINAQKSVVVSGVELAIRIVEDEFVRLGRQVKILRVSHGFHSPLMNPMLEKFRYAIKDLTFEKARIPLTSTVSGKLATSTELASPEYWVRHVSAPVRFLDAVDTLKTMGVSLFTELGPSSALVTHIPGAVPACKDCKVLLATLAGLHVQGVHVDWQAIYDGSRAKVIDLPTYPFQRRRYWMDPPARITEYSTLGHPILLNAYPLPDTEKSVFSGAISQSTHPWTADHSMGGQKLLPATALVELSLRAARECGCNILQELALLAPVFIPAGANIQIQLVLGESDASGVRTVDVYSRLQSASIQEVWTRHATGTVAYISDSIDQGSDAWPSWQSTDIPKAYATLQDAGISYGPTFQCVRSIKQSDHILQAQLQLPSSETSSGFMLHPALLDAALHTSLVAAPGEAETRLPFLITGARVFKPSNGPLCAHINQLDGGRLSVRLTDKSGSLVAEVASVSTRAWSPNAGELYSLQWSPAPTLGETWPMNDTDVVFRIDATTKSPNITAATHETVCEALEVIHRWAAEQSHMDKRLVVVTEKATVDTSDLAAAAAWGMVRSAQAELEDQLVLIDLDGTEESSAALPAAIATGQKIISIRTGAIKIPKLGLVPSANQDMSTKSIALNTSGSVLITGGTGALGSTISRHLVKTGAKHILLTSRSGRNAVGADALLSELTACGAVVRIEACDASNRVELEKILRGTDPPVTAVIHSAGIVDDAVLDSQTPERVSRVLRPKVDAAWNLHELLPENCSLVLFSSAAGMLGNRGQAGYAAGNCFLDALARSRTARGLPTYSMAWGPWLNEAGMASTIVHKGSLAPITDQQGVDLFDAVLRASEPVVAPLLLRGPVPFTKSASRTKAATSNRISDNQGSWQEQLEALEGDERLDKLRQLVSTEVSAVLGYEDALPDQPFADLGLDSFMGVQLRNRLGILTGLSLPGTLAFDHGSLTALTQYLFEELPKTVTSSSSEGHSVQSGITKPSSLSSSEEPVLRLASIYKRVCQGGHFKAAAYLLATASLSLPTFDSASSINHAPVLRRLASGSSVSPALVCIPDFFPQIAGLSIYAPIAAQLADVCDIYELPYPASTIPDTLSTLASMHAKTIQSHFAGRSVVLVGFSAGGSVAHEIATCLSSGMSGKEQSPRLAGVILIDTYLSTEDDLDWRFALPAAATARAGAQFENIVGDTAVAAMGGYLRLAEAWQPGKVEAPTLFLRARDAPQGVPKGEEWRAEWQTAERTVEVPGNHLELLGKYAEDTAAEIREWIGPKHVSKLLTNGHA